MPAALGQCLAPAIQVRRPSDGMPYALVSFPGAVGAIGGMNAAGLAITCAPLGTGENGSASRAHAAVARLVLQQAADLDAALAVLRRREGAGQWNACLSHAPSGQACSVRCDGASLEVRQSSGRWLAAATPETFCPEVQAELRAVSSNGSAPAAFREALRRSGAADGAAEDGRAATLSLLFDPQRREVWIRQSRGNEPADFACISLAQWLGPPSPAARREALPPQAEKAAEVGPPEAEEELFQEELHTQRFAMRMIDVPLKPDAPTTWTASGPALVLGHNPAADAIRRRLADQGTPVLDLAISDDVDATVKQFETLWKQGPIPHLFLMSGRDPGSDDLSHPAVWAEHRRRDAILPYFLCQRWLQLAGQARLLDRCTLLMATALGGDFGFSGRVRRPGGGAISGLAKAVWMEYVILRKLKSMVVKIIDSPDDEPAEPLAANILRELASGTLDHEVAFVAGRRRLQNAAYETAKMQPRVKIRPGAVWVVTGGAGASRPLRPWNSAAASGSACT